MLWGQRWHGIWLWRMGALKAWETAGALRNVSRLVDRAGRMGRVEPEEAEKPVPRTTQPVSGGHRESRRNNNISSAAAKTAPPEPETPAKESIRDAEFIKRGLEQMAASREKKRGGDENWIRDLKPEEVELIGDILKQYLA